MSPNTEDTELINMLDCLAKKLSFARHSQDYKRFPAPTLEHEQNQRSLDDIFLYRGYGVKITIERSL